MSNVYVYDKAEYHAEDENGGLLTDKQASVHTGLFVGWLLEHQLMSLKFIEESTVEIEQFLQKQMTGTDVYLAWDGALVSDMLSEEGNAFALAYFDFDEGDYLNDYEELFPTLHSLYDVEDTWDNYEKLKKVIDERYKEWKMSSNL